MTSSIHFNYCPIMGLRYHTEEVRVLTLDHNNLPKIDMNKLLELMNRTGVAFGNSVFNESNVEVFTEIVSNSILHNKMQEEEELGEIIHWENTTPKSYEGSTAPSKYLLDEAGHFPSPYHPINWETLKDPNLLKNK